MLYHSSVMTVSLCMSYFCCRYLVSVPILFIQLNMPHSIGYYRDPVEQAILRKNFQAAERLLGEIFEKDKDKRKKRVSSTTSLIQSQDTGM